MKKIYIKFFYSSFLICLFIRYIINNIIFYKNNNKHFYYKNMYNVYFCKKTYVIPDKKWYRVIKSWILYWPRFYWVTLQSFTIYKIHIKVELIFLNSDTSRLSYFPQLTKLSFLNYFIWFRQLNRFSNNNHIKSIKACFIQLFY